MWTVPFEGVDRIQLVGCRKTVENGFQLMQLKDHNSLLLVSWFKEGSMCEARGPYFAACVVDDAVSVVTLKVVVTDLQDGETRNFFCRAGYVLAEGLAYRDSNISVTYTGKYLVYLDFDDDDNDDDDGDDDDDDDHDDDDDDDDDADDDDDKD